MCYTEKTRIGGEKMATREEKLLTGFRDLYNKTVWLNKAKMEERLRAYKSSEVHCIEFIGKNKDCNVTKLAEGFYMTRGAISKLTKKLMEKGVIESYQRPENKKEIYFELTKKGQEALKIHEELHREFQKRDNPVFEELTEDEFNSMLQFVEKYNRHLDREIKKEEKKI